MISTLCSVAFVVKAIAIHSQLWRETQLFERGQKHRVVEVDNDHLTEAAAYVNLRIQGFTAAIQDGKLVMTRKR